jgi:N-acetylneuraminic acid mutarotase
MPTARWLLSASVVDGRIYVIGGAGGKTKVEEYDPATDTWTQKADLPTGRLFLSTAVVNGRIYAIGGRTSMYYWQGTSLATVEEYDPATDTWTARADAPLPIEGSSASVVDGKIYVIGNSLDGRALSTVQEYDPATDTWTAKADMPTARWLLSTSVVNGKIYALGGFPKQGGTSISAVEEYDPATETWATKAKMPSARTAPTVVVDGRIYVFGGLRYDTTFVEGQGGFPSAYEYDATTDSWAVLDDMPFERLGHAAAVVNGKVYIIGGSATAYPQQPFLQDVWEYDPSAEG